MFFEVCKVEDDVIASCVGDLILDFLDSLKAQKRNL